MTSDSALPDLVSIVSAPSAQLNGNLQVRFKSQEGRLLLILPAESETP